MEIQTFSYEKCTNKTYNVNYHPLHFGNVPLAGSLCIIDPSSSSSIHNHFEVEFFLFLSGNGRVIIDDKEIMVSQGTGVRIPAFSNHVIKNDSESEPLKFILFYWVDPEAKKINLDKKESCTLIFSTPPTPNGDLHLGHLSGPYLAADIYKRYLLQHNVRAFHVTGRDDHQSYILAKAIVEKNTPEKIA